MNTVQTIDRATTVNGAYVLIRVTHDGSAYYANAYGADREAPALASLPRYDGAYMPAIVARLQRECLDAARTALGSDSRSLQALADEMQRNGEMASARSLHRSLRGRR